MLRADPIAAQWYAGTWDSRMDNGMADPSTIVIRFEVEDAASGTPIRGAEIRLTGEYEDNTGLFTRHRDFRMSAYTDAQGIAVVALSWHTRSRYEVRVDDIERVQQLSVRSGQYEMFEASLDLSYLIGDDYAVSRLMETPGVRYFYLQPGPGYRHYGDQAATDALLFEKVRDQDYDLELPSPSDRFYLDVPGLSNPQAEAGPYLMIPYTVRLRCQARRGCGRVESTAAHPNTRLRGIGRR